MRKLWHRLGWRLVRMGFAMVRQSGIKPGWQFKDWADGPHSYGVPISVKLGGARLDDPAYNDRQPGQSPLIWTGPWHRRV